MLKISFGRNYTLRNKTLTQENFVKRDGRNPSSRDRESKPLFGGNRFDRFPAPFYTYQMQVNLPPELQAKLDRLAAQQGREPESLVNEAVERLVGYDEWFVRQVEKGLAQVERGEVLEHEQVVAKMENLIREKQHEA
jgi:predicted transcriptional regulator